jgi:hypothetical protein
MERLDALDSSFYAIHKWIVLRRCDFDRFALIQSACGSVNTRLFKSRASTDSATPPLGSQLTPGVGLDP